MTDRTSGPVLALALALAADLRDLAVDLAVGGYTRTNLAMLERNLLRSVSSALGATITLTRGDGENPVLVHLVARALQPDEIHTALRVPLPATDTSFEASITFYAAKADAFADLAHDLAEHLGVEVEHQAPPAHPVEPGTNGLTDLTIVNIALGHLINRGRTLAQARTELAALAQHHHTDLAAAARTLINTGSY